MRIRTYTITALLTLLLSAGSAAANSLRGSPESMRRQHGVAVEESLTFYRTPGAIIAEVAAGTLTPLEGNGDYRVANVSFAYAVPEVRVFVEQLAQHYRSACGERLVVTSLTRPAARQPRNAHVLSVHPAGMAVDLRISRRASCRVWLEKALLSLERAEVLDVTRERTPPHYHVAVFPSAYREYVARLEAQKPRPPVEVAPTPAPEIVHAAMPPATPPTSQSPAGPLMLLLVFLSTLSGVCRHRRMQEDRRTAPASHR